MGKSFSNNWSGSGQSDWGGFAGGGGKYQACYHSHPALILPHGGNDYKIYGGKCSDPIVKDADIYIGFNGVTNPSLLCPWDDGWKPVLTLDYPITDMCAPSDPKRFKKLVDWTCNQLQDGKKIHAGCIGGHGRTGTYLAAVARQFSGLEDAIAYVREHYCKKAVESQAQIDFLVKHFDIKPAEARKEAHGFPKSSGVGTWPKANGYQGSSGSPSVGKSMIFQNSTRNIPAVTSAKSVW